MKVFPDSKLYIISGCPCDPDYEHTLYWSNNEEQHAYFLTKAKYRVDAMSYLRTKRGKIKVQYKVEDLYDCNYIAFQNTSFGDKWFYAFIDDVTYVTNTTSEISYTIDVLQTWITKMDLQQCFVAREHSVTDVAGDNRVPENVDVGDMVMMSGYKNVIDMQEARPLIVVAKGAEITGKPNAGGFFGETYSQAEYHAYECTAEGIAQLQSYLESVGFFDHPEVVVSIFMTITSVGINKANTPFAATRQITLPGRDTLTRSDGSAVKNRKMLTYPYTFMRVSNASGQVHDYSYEFFLGETNTPTFRLCYSYSDTVSVTLLPMGYKAKSLLAANVDETITYNSFPKCAYAISDFARRLAIGGLSSVLSAFSTGFSSVGAAVLSGVVGGIKGLSSGEVNATTVNVPKHTTVAERYTETGVLSAEDMTTNLASQQSVAAAQMAGNTRPLHVNVAAQSGTDLYNANYIGPKYAQMIPTQEYIDRIDDYFSRYGYATNKIKTPNISSRPHWNYVQTVGCKINGSIPCTDEKLICSIFDKGVTFWKHPEEVGNFSLDNSPT